MKRLIQSKWWLPALMVLALALVACERPINSEEVNPTADPILPATLTVPTADPNAQPTTDPATAATAVPTQTTTDPAADATAVPEATATTAAETNQPRGEVSHTVVAGDTLTALSQQYNVSVEVIMQANGLSNADSLDVGQVLTIPAEGTEVAAPAETAVPTTAPPANQERTHVVQAGENLFRIGLQYGFTVDELASYNGIANPNVLDVGQVIKIPPSN